MTAVQTPCSKDPERWFSSRVKEINRAIDGCRGCPVRDACSQQAQADRPVHGVWGGVLWHAGTSWKMEGRPVRLESRGRGQYARVPIGV